MKEIDFSVKDVINEDYDKLLKKKRRLQEEFYLFLKVYSDKKDTFIKLWDETTDETKKELLNISDVETKVWRDWKVKKGLQQEPFDSSWSQFKKEWDFYNEKSRKMFKEMKKLSDELFEEWKYKYNFVWPNAYEKYPFDVIDYNKPKYELWEEFKQIWEMDDDMSEHYFNQLQKEIEDGLGEEYSIDTFSSYLEDANYHSYDSYSVLEKHEIWTDFIGGYSSYKERYGPDDSDNDSDNE